VKNYSKISIKEFWKRYSRNSIKFSKHPDLPLKLNLKIFINYYFGNLTNHEIDILNKDLVVLKCSNCINIENRKLDVCYAHTGIIEGQIENIFNVKIELFNYIDRNSCIIRNK
jgi:predicted hydrocarbon binding protein